MFEGLITLVLVGSSMAIGIALIAGISKLICKIDDLRISRNRKKAIAAVKLYRMVNQRVDNGLTVTEYDDAVRYTIRKYHLEDRNGAMDFRGQDIEYISMLISEAVQQNRIFQSTLATAQADAELVASEYETERKVITA
jgi:hypothetical protein